METVKLELTPGEAAELSMVLDGYLRSPECPEPDAVKKRMYTIIRQLDALITE